MMKRVVFGVMGHVNHGKTSLVRALTAIETDRLPEEKRRGISIALGFASCQLGDVECVFVDMPGHEDFIRTMISGATGVDAALLVVAANEGVKPQTIEHLEIAALLNVQRLVLVITKSDLASGERAHQSANAALAAIASAGIATPAPVLVSTLWKHGVPELERELRCAAQDVKPRPHDRTPFLPIDRAFGAVGFGPVVTGTLRGGEISTGRPLVLAPAGRLVRVRSIQVHGRAVPSARPGQRVALNLRDVELCDLRRGMALMSPGAMPSAQWLAVSMRAVANAPPLKNGVRLRALYGTDELGVRLRLLDREILAPGETAFAQLRCERPVTVPAGEGIVLRTPSPAATVAGGTVLDAVSPRMRRHSVATLARLGDLHVMPFEEALAAEVRRSGSAGAAVAHLTVLFGRSERVIRDAGHALRAIITQSGLVIDRDCFDCLVNELALLFSSADRGLSRDEIVSMTPGLCAAVADEALRYLVAAGTVVSRSGQFLVRGSRHDRDRTHEQAARAREIAVLLREGGLAPPKPNELIRDATSKRAVDQLLREGVIVCAVDRAKRKEILFHVDAIDSAKAMLAPVFERAVGVLVSEIGATLGISRKYSMPLLDHLDAVGFTQRVGDCRVRGPNWPAPLRDQVNEGEHEAAEKHV